MALGNLLTVKDFDELIAPECVELPNQLALTFQEPKTGGTYTSLNEPLINESMVLLRIDESGLV